LEWKIRRTLTDAETVAGEVAEVGIAMAEEAARNVDEVSTN
jgi:hypothetical protein